MMNLTENNIEIFHVKIFHVIFFPSAHGKESLKKPGKTPLTCESGRVKGLGFCNFYFLIFFVIAIPFIGNT